MFSVKRINLPDESLLVRYRNDEAYTDCYVTGVDRSVSLAQYIQAFYTTRPFRLERRLLTLAVAKPSSDDEVQRLAESRADSFAAWTVEARDDDQLLMSDYRGRTRSWLMVQPSTNGGARSTRLYFGSAVIPAAGGQTGERRMGLAFSALLPFHKFYSRVLLSSARTRLSG